MSTPMVPGTSYVDAQGTSYSVANSDDPSNGALLIAVVGRKFWQIYCDAARLSDGKFQFNLSGSTLWFQMTFAPIRSGFVPA